MASPRFEWQRSEPLITWSAALLLGLVHTVGTLFEMNPDGISYLNLSRHFASGDLAAGVDGYWSPLYPFLIGVLLRVVNPSPYWEAPLVHALNLAAYIAAFAAFRFFLHSVRKSQREETDDASFRIDFHRPAESITAHILFFATTLGWIGLGQLTPDLIVAAIVYAAGGLALRPRARPGARSFALLGALLGLGYLAKAVMFPLGIFFLLAASWTHRDRRLSLRRAAFAALGFFLVAAPQTAAVSVAAGKPAFAEIGPIAYGRVVNRYPLFWTGEPEGSGTPKNPMRIIHESPRAYEFAVADTRSSYPFWDHPAHWNAGMKPHFDLATQIEGTKPVLGMYIDLMASIAWALLVLLLFRDRGKSRRDYLFIIAAALGAFGLYALVHSEPRFFAAWAVMLFMGVAASLSFRGLGRAVHAVLIAFAIFHGIQLVRHTAKPFSKAVDYLPGDPAAHDQLQIATRLQSMGLREGSRVASIGYAFEGYWARLAGVQIAMEIPKERSYWEAPDSVKLAVNERFRRSGAVAIVANRVPREGPGRGWVSVGIGNYYVLPLAPELKARL